MTKRNQTLSPLAGTAIAAVLALSANPAAAQEAPVADPVMAAPPASAAPPPVETAPVLTSEPVVQTVPDSPQPDANASPAPVAAAPAERAVPNRTASARTVAAQPSAAAPSEVTAAQTAAGPADTAPVAVPLPADPASAAQPAPIVADQGRDKGIGSELGLGLLGLAALGGGAYALSRRRKVVPAAPVTAVADGAPVVRDRPAPIPPQRSEVTFDRHAPAHGEAFAGRPEMASAVTIPPGPLPTGPAMADLYHRMVGAAPDASNPFTSVKRRGKRARWLLKQHEYALNRQAAAEGFDFRSYRPSTRPGAATTNFEHA